MEDLINLAIYLAVGLFWLFFVLFGTKKKRPQKPHDEGELQFPFPFPLPRPLPEEEDEQEEHPAQLETKVEIPKTAEKITEPGISYAHKEEEKYRFDISDASLEEGIILSTILGPPKSAEIRAKKQSYMRCYSTLKS